MHMLKARPSLGTLLVMNIDLCSVAIEVTATEHASARIECWI